MNAHSPTLKTFEPGANEADPLKPLGGDVYDRIPHLPGSRMTDDDRLLDVLRARICCERKRDEQEVIIVQEKLDGSNVAVAKLRGQLIPLIRSGYPAVQSKYEHHRLFHKWVFDNFDRFDALLAEGERVVGEWLALAHGTRYALPHEPFVVFDIMTGAMRANVATVTRRTSLQKFVLPRIIHHGSPIGIEAVAKLLEPSGHGALDPVEGAVWRVERDEAVDFLAKYVRPDKRDGCWLAEFSGHPPIWNWRPK